MTYFVLLAGPGPACLGVFTSRERAEQYARREGVADGRAEESPPHGVPPGQALVDDYETGP